MTGSACQDQTRRKIVVCAALCAALAGMGSCKRAQQNLRVDPALRPVPSNLIPESDLQPGGALPPSMPNNPYEGNAYAISQGQQLFDKYNCSGCHFHGGGGIGPPFMNHQWIYGGKPAQIFASIAEGRPNGMPSWGRRIPTYQIWQLVTYVESLNGAEPKSVTPARGDSLEPRSSPPPR